MSSEWEHRALCKNDPDLWWTVKLAPHAIHICLVHCPVLWNCREKALKITPFGCAMGGLIWVVHRRGATEGRPGIYRSRPVACQECRNRTPNPCGYCGDSCGEDVERRYGPPVHPWCEDEYRQEVAEIQGQISIPVVVPDEPAIK